MAFDIKMIRNFYQNLPGKMEAVRAVLDHPLTLAEKFCTPTFLTSRYRNTNGLNPM